MIKYLRNYSVLVDGTVFKQVRLVPESVMLIGKRILLHNWKGLLKIRLLYRRKKLASKDTFVLVHNSYGGYYHWLLESIPRLLEARQALPEFILLIPATYTADFYEDTLRLLAIDKVAYLKSDTIYEIPNLALAYSEIMMGCYDLRALRSIKAALLEALPSLPVAGPRRRLYISRELAPRRKVLNEDEVVRMLSAQGYEIVCFENYTFEQQLGLCSTAEVIIGIHGAGLSNIVFQPPSAHIIELRKFDNGENTFYSELAHTLGFDYHLLYCAADDESRSVQDADLYVDLAKLEAVLHELGV